MAPHVGTMDEMEQVSKQKPTKAAPRKYKIVPLNVIIYVYLHLSALYGIYLCLTSAKWASIIFIIFLYAIADIGIMAGSHRLWAHKTYKAKMPLQIILMLFSSVALQDTVLTWARNHRLHHKYSDTDADPHNASRGFFFSHMGWLLVRKHPEVKERGKNISLTDLYNNPVLRFQKRYAILILPLACFILPTVIPAYFWNETLGNAWNLNIFRYVMNLHMTWLVNSIAHMWGNKPYDKNILPVENLSISLATMGEGFHNYHHVFPWDYRAAELSNNKYNWTTKFIDFFAMVGWAYDLKAVPKEVILNRSQRTGDGTNLWGLEDDDVSNEQKKSVEILARQQEESQCTE